MKSFAVVVRTNLATFSYTAIGSHSVDVLTDALDRFGVCKVTVRAA